MATSTYPTVQHGKRRRLACRLSASRDAHHTDHPLLWPFTSATHRADRSNRSWVVTSEIEPSASHHLPTTSQPDHQHDDENQDNRAHADVHDKVVPQNPPHVSDGLIGAVLGHSLIVAAGAAEVARSALREACLRGC